MTDPVTPDLPDDPAITPTGPENDGTLPEDPALIYDDPDDGSFPDVRPAGYPRWPDEPVPDDDPADVAAAEELLKAPKPTPL